MNKNKKKRTLIRWFIARLICLTHLSISIFLLLTTKYARHLFFVPIIGVSLIILEIIISSFLKFRFQYRFILLFIYSVFIISTIWLLELNKINYLTIIKDQQASVEVFSVIYYAPIEPTENFSSNNKYLWSQIQIQVYIVFVFILKGLFETEDHRLDNIFKTWSTALDILDFINLLSLPKLYSNIHFAYITLSIWSISCLQFTIQVSTVRNILLKRNHPRLACIMTYSLISVIITDIPYLIFRIYVIFGVRNHDYTSYFLVFKNIVVTVFQTADVWVIFNETTRKKTKGTSV